MDAPSTIARPLAPLRLIWWCIALVLAGAGLLVSGLRNPNRAAVVPVSSPRAVLVAVTGAAGQPGFAGFIAVVQANGRSVYVVPVPGAISVSPKDPAVPLWLQADTLDPAKLARVVDRHAHIRLSGYVVVREPDLEAVLQLLALDVRGWPKTLPPDVALERLGWPTGVAKVGSQAALFNDLITYLPQLPPRDREGVTMMQQDYKTNLSPDQVYLLGTYIHGGSLRMAPWSQIARLAR